MRVTELPSQEELLKIFYYDGKLRWLVDIKSGRRHIKAGDEAAGITRKDGYKQISLNYKIYLYSRILYQLVHGNLTQDFVIDHINRNPLDNRIENLRAVSQKHNCRNISKQKNNRTGVNGVTIMANKYIRTDGSEVEYTRYVATWYSADCKCKKKSFSIAKYGNDLAFKLACDYRSKMIESLIQQGEWYDPKHGL